MKKILTILSFIFAFAASYGQAPKQLNAYNPQTQVNFLGTIANDSGLVFRKNYPDTTTANFGWIKNIPNVVIVINDTLYKRSNDATGWSKLGSGGGPTIYTGDGSLSGDRLIELNNHQLQITQNGNNFLYLNPILNDEYAEIRAYNSTGDGNYGLWYGHVTPLISESTLRVNFNDNIGSEIELSFDGVTKLAEYTADTHTFNGFMQENYLTYSTIAYAASITANYHDGPDRILTLTGDANVTFSNLYNGAFGTWIIIQDGTGGHQLTVPSEILTINTDPGDTTVIGFTYDGTTMYWTSSAGGSGGQTLTISSPLTGTSYNGSVPVSIGIQNAAADGSTKGAASFSATYFDASSGNITPDLTNGLASGSQGGWLSSADWTTFNNKAPTASPTFTGTVTIPTPFTLGAISVTTTGTRLNFLNAAGGTTGTTSTNIVFSTSPTLVTPVLGVATATSINGNTFTTGTYTLTGGSGKTLTFNNSITLTGTDATTMTFPTTTATIARTDAAQTFTGVQTLSSAPILSTATLTANSVTHTFPTVAGTVAEYQEGTTASGSAGTVTPTGDSRLNYYQVTAASTNLTIAAPSGTPANHNELQLRILDNGTTRTITWNAIFRASSNLALPTGTTVSKTMYCKFFYNSASTTWDIVSFIDGFAFSYGYVLIALILAGLATAVEKRKKSVVLIMVGKKSVAIVMVIVVVINCQGQTRFYPNVAVASYFRPTLNAVWDETTVQAYDPMSQYKYGNTATNTTAAIGVAAVSQGINLVFITEPLLAQTINSGSTISSQFKLAISTTSSTTGQGLLYARLMNINGTIASEIGNAQSTNLATTPTANRTITITLGSNLTVTAGQRLEFEYGWNYSVGTNTTRTTTATVTATVSLTDLPVDNTTTTVLNSWIETSQTLLLQKSYRFFF